MDQVVNYISTLSDNYFASFAEVFRNQVRMKNLKFYGFPLLETSKMNIFSKKLKGNRRQGAFTTQH